MSGWAYPLSMLLDSWALSETPTLYGIRPKCLAIVLKLPLVRLCNLKAVAKHQWPIRDMVFRLE